MSIVIVAIPREEDPVWKYSTEKVPHMTLLYLGDGPLTDEENVVKYIQHVAATSLREFGMTKDRRGPLGPDRADVLFFDKGWANKDLERVRSYLLKNEAIAQAYLSAKQFNMWTPHLTMGYPTKPAKTLDNPWELNYVQFDRIAIWFGDSEGPEFPLRKQFDDVELPIAHAKFSESKVVRDGDGMFSKKAGGTELSDEELDELRAMTPDALAKHFESRPGLKEVYEKRALEKEASVEADYALKSLLKKLPGGAKAPVKKVPKKTSGLTQSAIDVLAEKVLAHADADVEPLELYHFGTKGMRWGVRRRTGPDGRVVGLPPGLKRGAKSDDPLAGVIAKAKKGKDTSDDHKKLVKDLAKTVEKLSTADINAINARIKSVEKLKENQAKIKLANTPFHAKLAKFALNSVVAATKEKGDAYVKSLTKDLLDDVLPKSPFGKDAKAKAAKDADEAAAKARKDTKDDEIPPSAKDHPNYKTPPGPTSADFGQPSPERQKALETLADQIARQNG